LYSIIRDPITPYSTEKVGGVLYFDILKDNGIKLIQKFFSTLELIVKSKHNDIEFILKEKLLTEGIKEFESLKDQGICYKARKITAEGPIYGYCTISEQDTLVFNPILNQIYSEPDQIKATRIKGFLKYRYLFKHTAIEIWQYNEESSVLLDFYEKDIRDSIYNFLKSVACKRLDKLFHKEYITSLWVNGHLSNFEYLNMVNILSNRSYNDLSQYPIFPWVISDFTSPVLDLTNPKVYRDLTRPVGAINKHRLKKYKDQYEDLLNSKHQERPYLYSTHYSTPGYVVYFLIRKIPEFVIKLQNGVFGPAERLFQGVETTWFSTVNSGSDVKELIPEFYCLHSDFLINSEKLQLGVTPDGDVIDDVVLPQWATSGTDFTHKMRMALESEYVSSNLHHWIDLIFGYKQSGEQAVLSDNVFYPLTYEENVNWDDYPNIIEREALEVQISEFGQVPLQLFQSPHHPMRAKLSHVSKSNNKDLGTDDKDLLQNRLVTSMQEVEKLRNELDHVNQLHSNNIRTLKEDFKSSDRKKTKYVEQLQLDHKKEMEDLKKQSEDNKNYSPRISPNLDGKMDKDAHYEKLIVKIKKEYEEKILRISKKYESNEYVKTLENANTSLKRKLKNYEEIIQAFQKENLDSSRHKRPTQKTPDPNNPSSNFQKI
jgi:factor associated with neutral sphingomyelinase activation